MRDSFTDYDDGYDVDYDTPADDYDDFPDTKFWGDFPY